MSANLIPVGRGVGGTRWSLCSPDESLVQSLVEATGEDEIIVRCLVTRGLTTVETIRDFLNPHFLADAHDPFLLRDMEKAVARLREAIAKRERIFVVTDFDVDGTTSSVIIASVLKALGGDGLIKQYVPNRFTEGYGLSPQIVNQAADEGYGLIVTADIGIKSHKEARLARERNIDLIICDHHLPDGEDVPAEAFAVLCPKGSSGTGYPNKHLAACGVALKLADALLEGHPKREMLLGSLAKLTAIGSIADLVDIGSGENRAIVAHGLQELGGRSPNPGLRALLAVSDVKGRPTPYDVGYKIGPRINAAGRIEHANLVIDLFNATEDTVADALASTLDRLNAERQKIQRDLVSKLLEEAGAAAVDSKVLVFAGPEEDDETPFHRGVVGIACSKIVEEYGRPTLICAVNAEGEAHGSARSIDGFHMVEALDSVSSLLTKYGGHPMAAGFTLKADRIDEFRRRLNEYADKQLTEEDLGRRIIADAELPLEKLTPELIHSLGRLEPHGMGNRSPQFLLRGVPLREIKVLKDVHLKFTLGEGRTYIDALWWNAAEFREAFAMAKTVSIIGRIEINEWNGRERCQIVVRDATPEPAT